MDTEHDESIMLDLNVWTFIAVKNDKCHLTWKFDRLYTFNNDAI